MDFYTSAERASLLRVLRQQHDVNVETDGDVDVEPQQELLLQLSGKEEAERLVGDVLRLIERSGPRAMTQRDAERWRALVLIVQSHIASRDFTEEIQSDFMAPSTYSNSSSSQMLKALHSSLISSDRVSELIRLSTFFHLLERSGGEHEPHAHHVGDFASSLALVKMATRLEKVVGDKDVVERLFSQAGFEARTNSNNNGDDEDGESDNNSALSLSSSFRREEVGERGEIAQASISGSSFSPGGDYLSSSAAAGGGSHKTKSKSKSKNKKKNQRKNDFLSSSSAMDVQSAIENATMHSLCTLWTQNVLQQTELIKNSSSSGGQCEVDQVHVLCILEHSIKQVEKEMLSIETEKLNQLEELSSCGVVVDHIRTLHALTKVVLEGPDDLKSLKAHVETLVLQLMRRVSKRIVNKGSMARTSQAIILIEILKFVLSRSVTNKSDEVYLFDTRRCLSVLFSELFQVHYRNLLVCTEIFDLCSSYEDVLTKCYADLVCQGYPTALKAAILWPKKFSAKMPCFVQSMNSCDLCIPLVQSVLDAPILALLMDDKRNFTRMVEEKASREILQSFVEDEQSNNVEDMMQVEDIFNLLSPKVSDLCSTLDVPATWPRLLKDIQRMSEEGLASAGGFRREGEEERGNFQSAGAVRCNLVIKYLMPELLNAVFVSLLEKPQVGKLCSIITLIINRFMSGTLYPNKAYGNACIEHSLLFISNALHLKPKMLVMLKNTLLRLFILEETSISLHYNLQKVKTSLLREIGIILSGSQSSTFYEDVAYQIVDTLETLIQEKASTWQDRLSKDFNTLKLICAAMTAMTRIVVVHSSLLTRVDLMLRKICHKGSHTFVLNRANESLKLVQMPEDLSYLILQAESSVASAFKKAAKLL